MAQDCREPIRKCNEALAACDSTIKEKNKALELADLTIKKCVESGITKQYQLNEAKAELDKFYRNPWIMGGLGILTGFILSKTVLK